MSTAVTAPQGPLLDDEAAVTLARLNVILLLGSDEHMPMLIRRVVASESASMMKNLDTNIRNKALSEITEHFNGLLKHARDNDMDNEASTLETVCRQLGEYARGTLKLVQP